MFGLGVRFVKGAANRGGCPTPIRIIPPCLGNTFSGISPQLVPGPGILEAADDERVLRRASTMAGSGDP